MTVSVSIYKWIRFKKNIGLDGLLITGLPGTGKSNMANRIIKDCLEINNENFIIPGDRFCEWANVAPYFNKVVLLVPKGSPIHRENVPVKYKSKEIDYETLNIFDYLKAEDKKKLIIIYDAHYRKNLLWKRTELWVKIYEQLLDRTILLDSAIGLVFHEAGIYFPELAESDQWKSVTEFANLFVDSRKGFIRFIGITQLSKEMKHTIRSKCLWHIYRQGFITKDNPRPIVKRAPFLALNQYILSFGGVYTLDNVVVKVEDFNTGFRMIPIDKLEEIKTDTIKSYKHKLIMKLYSEGFAQDRLGKLFEYSQQRISQIVNA